MKSRITDRLKRISSTAWATAGAIAVLSGVIAFVAWGAGAWPGVEDVLSDFVGYVEDFAKTDVQMWHLLLAMFAAAVIADIVGVIFIRVVGWPSSGQAGGGAEAPKPSIWSTVPNEIAHFRVLWPVTAELDSNNRVTNFVVGKPMCSKCRSTLGWLPSDELGNEAEDAVSLPNVWEKIAPNGALLECFKDGTQYDLRREGWSLGGLAKIVSDVAMGEYRTAQAKARGELK